MRKDAEKGIISQEDYDQLKPSVTITGPAKFYAGARQPPPGRSLIAQEEFKSRINAKIYPENYSSCIFMDDIIVYRAKVTVQDYPERWSSSRQRLSPGCYREVEVS